MQVLPSTSDLLRTATVTPRQFGNAPKALTRRSSIAMSSTTPPSASLPSSSTVSPPPPLLPPQESVPVPPITNAMLEEARRQFLRFGREPTAGDDRELAGAGVDVDVDESVAADDSKLEVVIAHGVTSEQYEAIDQDWLGGLVVELRDDGTLVLVDVCSNEHDCAQGDVYQIARNYAAADQGLQLGVFNLHSLIPGGANNRTPRVTITQPMANLSDMDVPLVIFIINVDGDVGFREMIRTAAHYFETIPTVVRVIGLNFFRPRVSAAMTRLHVPALALAFARGDQFHVNGRVCVLVARSFGNAPVHGSIIRVLQDPQHANLPMEPLAHVAALNGAPFAGVLDVRNVREGLNTWRRERDLGNRAVPAPMVVPMPQGMPPLVLPLFEIFVAAMHGWAVDALLMPL